MQIESSIIQALKNLEMPTNIIPVLADRGGVEPRAPYLLINVINSTNIAMPTKSVTHSLTSKTESIFQVRDYYVSFTFHADAKDPVQDWIQSFYTALYSDIVDYAFSQQGLGLVDSENIMYQAQPVDGKNYKRAIMNITFRAEIQDSFTINALNSVEYEGFYLGGKSYVKVNVAFPESMYLSAKPLSNLVNYKLPQSLIKL